MIPSILRVVVLSLAVSCAAPGPSSGAVVHSVFFELRDSKDALALAASCSRRLDGIPGILSLVVGPREETQERPTNDRGFHVALTIVFEDVEALEAYLVHPWHLSLVEDFAPRIESLRVFDSRVLN